jgi:hypothetical protein
MERPTADNFSPVFGSPFNAFLTEPILIIGKDKWNRMDLADMSVTQLRAARIVTDLAKHYRAKDTKDLYSKLSPASLASNNGVGLHSLFVLWRAFESHNLNPLNWYWSGREGSIVTFTSIKAREHREQAAERKARPRRAQIALDEAAAAKRGTRKKKGNGHA